jgi:RNA polymerase sigma-70 factor (ECF subfamily)
MEHQLQNASGGTATQFATTHWSEVLAAGNAEPTRRSQALELLCSAYWYPIYAFVRRQGHEPADAQDLTQEFFARLLAKKYLERVETDRGRFRSFLLTVLKHFLADEWDKVRAQKRGGGQRFVSLDESTAETRYGLEPQDQTTPERLYERRWALTILERALDRLRDEHIMAGKGPLFDQLRVFITGDRGEVSYAEAARRLSTTEGAAKMAVTRMRQRYRELLRAEIANTVERHEDIDKELRYLAAALRG